MVDEILVELSPRFKKLYSNTGRPSIAPEKLLRALLLQILYSVRSERLLVERRPRDKLAETSPSINVIPAGGGAQSRVEMHVL
jgi:transposase